MSKPSTQSWPVHHNRIEAVISHLPDYQSHRVPRLCRDSGVSTWTLRRAFRGRYRTSLLVRKRLQRVINGCLGRYLTLAELFSENGRYPTRYVCRLVGCPGCLPESQFAPDGTRLANRDKAVPGRWTGDTAEFMPEVKR